MKNVPTTYPDYANAAASDNYPLRYEWVRQRVKARVARVIFFALFLGTLGGCELAQKKFSDTPGYVIIGIFVFVGLLLLVFFGKVIMARTELGFVEFRPNEIVLMGQDFAVSETFPLSEVSTIRQLSVLKETDFKARTYPQVVELELKLQDGTIHVFQCMSDAFFSSRHEPFMCTLQLLKAHLQEQYREPLKEQRDLLDD
jgi:hypothetical protein